MLWLFERIGIMEIESFINQHKSEDEISKRIFIFETIRDFLYQINWVSDSKKLLEIKEWYCTSKHRLLKEVYDKLWYQTQLCFIPFSFDMIYLPDALKDWWYANKKWYHTFLQMMINNEWINIDATFNSELRDFYVVNKNRDWISSQKIICDYDEIYISNSPDEERKIKKSLSYSSEITDKDYEWINKYNERIRLFSKKA